MISYPQLSQHPVQNEHTMGHFKEVMVVLLTTKKAGYRKISYILGTCKK